jgi:dolichol-phosphate mannosyltransferase
MDLSIAIPIFNEADNLKALYSRLDAVLSGMRLEYEIIFIEDGSVDDSLEIIKNLASNDAHVKYIAFSRNFGHQIAIYAGMEHAKGAAVVTMDGDLQDPPELIVDLYKQYSDEKFDIVYAKRMKRKGMSLLKRICYKVFYRVLAKITAVDIPLDVGDFRIVNKKVVRLLKRMSEQEKFLRGQIAWMGFKSGYLEYEREAREHGDPGYTYQKLITLAIDGITSFSTFPLKVASITGFIVSFLSFVAAARALYIKLFTDNPPPQGFTSLVIIILFLGGIQLITIGIIGEYLSRMNNNIKNRPTYIVEEANL